MQAFAKKHKVSLQLLLLIATTALVPAVATFRRPPEELVPAPTLSELSVTGIKLGMPRAAVEERFGPGTSNGEDFVYYGGTWTETNPFDVERHRLSVGFDQNGYVNRVTGQTLELNGSSLKPQGPPEFVLGKFGPTDGPLVAFRIGDREYDNATILPYRAASIEIEYYNENRMWVSIYR